MSHGRPILVCALALLLAARQAHAAHRDRKPPKIAHTPVTQAEQGVALEIRAKIEDPSGVFEPTLFYRSAGSREFLRATLAGAGGEYVATIPAAAVVGEIEYFVEAFDEQGNGPARVGSPQKPLVVKVLVVGAAPPANGTGTVTSGTGTSADGNGSSGTSTPDPTPVPDPGPATSATPPDPSGDPGVDATAESEGDNTVLIAAIAGGAGALLLAGAGTVLVWALFLNPPQPPGSVTVVVTAPPPVQSLQGVP